MNKAINLLEEYKKGIDDVLLRANECLNTEDAEEIEVSRSQIYTAINLLNHFRHLSEESKVKYIGIVFDDTVNGLNKEGALLQMNDIKKEIVRSRERRAYLGKRIYRLQKRFNI